MSYNPFPNSFMSYFAAVREKYTSVSLFQTLSWVGVVFAMALINLHPILAQDEPPPLPLHGIEGSGGIFSTYSAYLVNPAKEDQIFGLPSVAGFFVHLGQGRSLETVSITETLWDRLEIGYAWNGFDLGDLPEAVWKATGAQLGDDYVNLHNFNARVALIKENDFDQSWVPAVTAGVHYKYNDTIDSLDDDLAGTLSGYVGIENNDGVDFTLYASKMLTFLPRPVLINAGLRATEAAHLGLLGFTDEYEVVFEGNVAVFVTDQFILSSEFRQKPDNYTRIPGLIEDENDWFTILAAYVINDHLAIGGGYAHFGDVLNHEANGSWGVQVKWEF